MFANPNWFQNKALGWGLRPVAWQGWVYAVAWMAGITGPFVGFVVRHQVPEALIWLTASMGTLLWEVRGLRRSRSPTQGDNVLFIADDGSCEQVTTRQFQLRAGK